MRQSAPWFSVMELGTMFQRYMLDKKEIASGRLAAPGKAYRRSS
jgi:hypothetical protein